MLVVKVIERAVAAGRKRFPKRARQFEKTIPESTTARLEQGDAPKARLHEDRILPRSQ